jgi:hypothetical protein
MIKKRGKRIIHHQTKFLKNKLIYPMSYSSGIFNLETSFKLEFELEKGEKKIENKMEKD